MQNYSFVVDEENKPLAPTKVKTELKKRGF